MDLSQHSLSDLFSQLGLPDDEENIELFISTHKPLRQDIRIARAPWWTPAQRAFLEEAIDEDSDWAIAVGQLDSLLRIQ